MLTFALHAFLTLPPVFYPFRSFIFFFFFPFFSFFSISQPWLPRQVLRRSSTTLRLLLSAGLDPSAVNKHGQTALHIAARLSALPGHVNMLSLLIAAGAPVNLEDESGATALDVAVAFSPSSGPSPGMDTLLAAGAQRGNVRPRSGRGRGGGKGGGGGRWRRRGAPLVGTA